VRRLFLLVAAVLLVDTMFYAAITPLLPTYTDDFDLSKAAAGILSASYAAGTLAGALPGGWFAARVGPKAALLFGLSLMGVASLVFAFGASIVLLDAARFMQGIGGAFSWAGGLAWLIAVAPGARRGALIGSALAAAIVGVLLGPVLGGAATVVGPEPVFCAVAVVAVVLATWAWAIPRPIQAREARTWVGPALFRNRGVVAGFWLVALPALFSGTLVVLAPLRLDDLGASGVAVGAIFLGAAAVEAALTPLLGRLSDRRGRLAPIRLGLVGVIVIAVAMPLPTAVAVLAVLVVGVVSALAAFWAPAMALLSDAAETAGLAQGMAFALTNLAWAGGQSVGGTAGSAIAEATSDAVPYVILAALCALTLLVVTRARALGRLRAPAGAGHSS
jgi:MFS family permease